MLTPAFSSTYKAQSRAHDFETDSLHCECRIRADEFALERVANCTDVTRVVLAIVTSAFCFEAAIYDVVRVAEVFTRKQDGNP